MTQFSEFIVFADESGDHGMATIDPQFPVFALIFCVFAKQDYTHVVEPAIRQLKFDFFGHDAIVLHERDIRKQSPPFDFLRGDPERREAFHQAINDLVTAMPVRVIAAVIDKAKHRERYDDPWNPYQIALHFCLERLCALLKTEEEAGRLIHVLFEGRGAVEDKELGEVFERIANDRAHWGWRRTDFRHWQLAPVFVQKAANMAGHQLSDLIARPLALRVLRPDQPNRAAAIAQRKLVDLKIFP